MEPKKIIIPDQDSEADTCRKEVTPKLYASQWIDDQILEQRVFTDGKIITLGKVASRQKPKKADYILRIAQNFPIAVVEAKKSHKNVSAGLQQAKEYANILGLKFAYSTNGSEIVEYDFTTGQESLIDKFPTPQQLWDRLNQTLPIQAEIKEILLKGLYANPDKPLRYYQEIAINKAIQRILEGQKRVLLTLATGTGKTSIAFQIIYKLWNNRWNINKEHRRPKVLFLADRSILVDDPHAKDFAVFGDARCLVSDDGAITSREIYFATYQSMAEDSSRQGLFRSFPRNFFDLLVIDECHRGSANEEGNWRSILDYFTSACQLGLTATPLRQDNRDTYEYFGNPIYVYSLKQGIEDGFLAPYVVRRVVPNLDATGWRPQQGQTDAYGHVIPDGLYTTPDFEKRIVIEARTRAVATHLTEYMKKHGRMDKTIVFCVDMEHADLMRRELTNLNKDMMMQNHNYVVRIVSEEGDVGKGLLNKFMDIEESYPVIVTTSKMLSVGVDVPTCKNIVIVRQINSMSEFKQIVGRGTRVREDKGKMFFTILDYTGSATRNFADPEFDGQPPLITTEKIDDEGKTVEGSLVKETPEDFPPFQPEEELTEEDENIDDDNNAVHPRKYYLRDGVKVFIVAETVQILDAGGQLRTIQFTQYIREQIISLFPEPDSLRNAWSQWNRRQEILKELESRGIPLAQLSEIAPIAESDPFDMLCFVAYDLKPMTRRERAERVRKARKLEQYSKMAREIIYQILDKYVEFGHEQITPGIVQVKPIADKGNLMEIAQLFGGADKLGSAINDIQLLLYSDSDEAA